MPERIDTVIASLQDEEKTLLSRKTDLDQQASELEAALKRIRGALSALGVASATRTKSKKGPSKPSPDKHLVRDAVTASLQEQALHLEPLRVEVERQVVERGYSRMGLSLRLKEVLGEDRFTRASHDDQLIMLQDPAAKSTTSELQENAAESSS
ncbi:hypothetical protein [Bythopirellula goksoeyrii]|uniref:Uncharacterized protein n=1 Tax=Bythopirellula goksoeyrii TaxID=1400387 RepID=A0A5B9QUT7_9BACT|nr:hypothetical protein [Bythopirellula goksoeyrii]QEG37693.1 hypothetical protein Pr1d_50390 [Bythopirellula goksoeyrii]